MAENANPNRNPDFVLRGQPDQKARRAHRRELVAAGTKGPALRQGMQDWKKGQRQEYADTVNNEVGDDFSPYVKHPKKFLKGVMQGRGPAMRRLMRLRQASSILGYDKSRDRLSDEYGRQFDALAGEAPDQAGSKIEVERDFQETPTFSNFQNYVAKHINPETGEAAGLTSGEENAIRGSGRRAIGSAATSAFQNQGERLAAAGIDPRSGLGATQAQQVEAGRQNSMAELEHGITDTNLGRKQQFEGYASDLGRAEEQRRQFDVSGDLRRLADVESGQRDLAHLDEDRRQFDVGYTESQRQAKLAREAARRAARDLEPSTLDKVAGGVSGFIGGLTSMGGGGGGGGGMGGMMGGMGG